jgi:hypothetical protein
MSAMRAPRWYLCVSGFASRFAFYFPLAFAFLVSPFLIAPHSRCSLALPASFCTSLEMGLPSQPITLTVEQIGELNKKLSAMRHDINNNLSLIIAAVDLIKHKPQTMERMMTTLADQPTKITDNMNKFSAEFERMFGITRP